MKWYMLVVVVLSAANAFVMNRGGPVDFLFSVALWWWLATVSGVIGSRYAEAYKYM